MDTTIDAKNKFVRIAPRKLRLVAGIIRGKDAMDSLDQLRFLPKKGSLPMFKVLKSAMANAEHNFNVKSKDLYIKEVRVDEAPTYKRARIGSRSRVQPILKRNSSIYIKLAIKK